MYIDLDGARLFYEAVGGHLDPSVRGGAERSTMLVLHGGPGQDHLGLRAQFDRYIDVVQVVYLDHRGNGRSRQGKAGDPAEWNLDRWADDVAEVIDRLGLTQPIVYGQSFGGMVAQRYAVRHQGQFRALVLSSTSAKFLLSEVVSQFTELGGPEVGAIAERFWTRMTEPDIDEYFEVCNPFYTYDQSNPIPGRSPLFAADVLRHFAASDGEIHLMDHRPQLATISSPVLVISGDRDPVTPPERSEEIAKYLPRAQLAIVQGAGHGAYRDRPQEFETELRRFLSDNLDPEHP